MQSNIHSGAQTNPIVKWSVAAAIVIVANLLFYYAIAAVYAEPKFEAFCPVRAESFNMAEACVVAGGQWTNMTLSPQQVTESVQKGEPLGWCDPNFTCQQDYDEAQSIYNRNVFIVMIVVSLAALAVGIFVGIEVLSLGFALTGVVALVIASARYWSDAHNWMRVIILMVALALLVWFAIKKFQQKEGEVEEKNTEMKIDEKH